MAKIKKNNYYIIFFCLLPVISYFVSQYIIFEKTFNFFKSINFSVVMFNSILWISLLLFTHAIFKKYYIAFTFYIAILLLFSLSNSYKIKFLNQPLYFSDFSLIHNLFPFILKLNILDKLVIYFESLILFLVVIKPIIRGETKKNYTRIIYLSLSVLVLTSSYFFSNTFNLITKKFNINFSNWNPVFDCATFGSISTFVNNVQYIKHSKPKYYSLKSINKLFINNRENSNVNINDKPNIIFIMSEAFWDVTRLPNINLSSDPIDNVRNDIKGSLVSPVFGGNTSNVEFEFLTGLNNIFFSVSEYPYNQYINRSTPSLANVFKDNGYSTSVIHPNSSWFYNRKTVYKYFGFDDFISIEKMTNPKFEGPYVSEETFYSELIKQIESSNSPQFIFAISVQNHGPYEINRFTENSIKMDNNLSSDDQGILHSYITGIQKTDQQYEKLKEYLKNKTNKPTILVFFGDHLPYLGPNFDIYKKTNYIPQNESIWTLDDGLKMKETPIAIWSNYKDLTEYKLNKLSPSFLSNTVFELSDIKPNYQFIFTNMLSLELPVINNGILIDKLGNKYNHIGTFQSSIDNYKLIEYDVLFGKQYSINN